MGDIANKLQRIIDERDNIADAIRDKGVDVDEGEKLENLPSKIQSISTAPKPSSTNDYWVAFLNYNESLVKLDFVESGNNATPPEQNPTRDGYLFTNWDKSYEDITENTFITAEYEPSPYDAIILETSLTEQEYPDMESIFESETAMNEVVNSELALETIILSQGAMVLLANTEIAMNVIANSETAMNGIIENENATNIIANSETAMNIIANSESAINIITNSETAMNSIANSESAMIELSNNETSFYIMLENEVVSNVIGNIDLSSRIFILEQTEIDYNNYSNLDDMANSETAMNAIASSEKAMHSLMISSKAKNAINSSQTAENEIRGSGIAKSVLEEYEVSSSRSRTSTQWIDTHHTFTSSNAWFRKATRSRGTNVARWRELKFVSNVTQISDGDVSIERMASSVSTDNSSGSQTAILSDNRRVWYTLLE